MKMRKIVLSGLCAATVFAGAYAPTVAAAEQFFPVMVYRTGPYAPNGIPFANGYTDYLKLMNARDGGINGVKVTYEECDHQYKTNLGVECYEKLKNKGPTGATIFQPLSTGVTYQLIPKASVDKIVILSSGYGRTAAADGRVFKWIFNFPTSYWSQASAFIRYVGQEEGGMDKLKGMKIAHIYHNSAYGKEANPTLQTLSKKYGFKLTLLAVDHPGQEQKATWLQIRRLRPKWIFMSGWGVMNQVAIKEAANIKFPMDHFVGNWWSGTESDVRPAGKGAIGYKSAAFHGAGMGWPVFDDIVKDIYGGDKAKAQANHVGEVLYDRGMVSAMFSVEAVRGAMKKFGNKPMTGTQVRWGMEHLNLTEARLKEMGIPDFLPPIHITCADHENNGPVRFQQWDGKHWKFVSGWISPMREVVRPMIEKAAAAYAKENNITPRDCSKES